MSVVIGFVAGLVVGVMAAGLLWATGRRPYLVVEQHRSEVVSHQVVRVEHVQVPAGTTQGGLPSIGAALLPDVERVKGGRRPSPQATQRALEAVDGRWQR